VEPVGTALVVSVERVLVVANVKPAIAAVAPEALCAH
jgi:hypothetical protein